MCATEEAELRTLKTQLKKYENENIRLKKKNEQLLKDRVDIYQKLRQQSLIIQNLQFKFLSSLSKKEHERFTAERDWSFTEKKVQEGAIVLQEGADLLRFMSDASYKMRKMINKDQTSDSKIFSSIKKKIQWDEVRDTILKQMELIVEQVQKAKIELGNSVWAMLNKLKNSIMDDIKQIEEVLKAFSNVTIVNDKVMGVLNNEFAQVREVNSEDATDSEDLLLINKISNLIILMEKAFNVGLFHKRVNKAIISTEGDQGEKELPIMTDTPSGITSFTQSEAMQESPFLTDLKSFISNERSFLFKARLSVLYHTLSRVHENNKHDWYVQLLNTLQQWNPGTQSVRLTRGARDTVKDCMLGKRSTLFKKLQKKEFITLMGVVDIGKLLSKEGEFVGLIKEFIKDLKECK